MDYGIIGGTGVYDPDALSDREERSVTTPYGDVTVQTGVYKGVRVAFMPRHGAGHSIPPHMINYRANLWAMKALNVGRVLATAAVGSLNPGMTPGHFVVIDQFLDFTKERASTFFDGGDGVVHIDVTEPYCPVLRRTLTEQSRALGVPVHEAGVYVSTEGPRFESAAEIKAYRMLGGDVVGMTNVPEAVLAREAGLCYATVAMVTNMGAGMGAERLAHDDVVAVMADNTANVRDVLFRTIQADAQRDAGQKESTCACGVDAPALPGLPGAE